jgi:hypothetical protein
MNITDAIYSTVWSDGTQVDTPCEVSLETDPITLVKLNQQDDTAIPAIDATIVDEYITYFSSDKNGKYSVKVYTWEV